MNLEFCHVSEAAFLETPTAFASRNEHRNTRSSAIVGYNFRQRR